MASALHMTHLTMSEAQLYKVLLTTVVPDIKTYNPTRLALEAALQWGLIAPSHDAAGVTGVSLVALLGCMSTTQLHTVL